MTTSAHKTAPSNRPQTMHLYPSSFTGMERDEETGYGYFGARYMDYELMTMWLSVDRYASKYPSLSPYAYCAWNPIRLIDPSGDTICFQLGDVKYYYTSTENGYAWVDKSGNQYSGDDKMFNRVIKALETIQSKPVGKELVDKLINDNNTVQIVFGRKNASDSENGEWITWNPYKIEGNFLNEDGTRERPSFIGLGHELAHIYETWHGNNDQSEWFKTAVGNEVVPKCEKVICNVENQLRKEHGIARREYYFYYEDNKHGKTYRQGLLLND